MRSGVRQRGTGAVPTRWVVAAALTSAACGPSLEPPTETGSRGPTSAPVDAPVVAAVVAPEEPAAVPPPPPCLTMVPVWRDGQRAGEVCPEEAAAAGLTVLDLGDGWVPKLFRPDPHLGPRGRSSYADRYLTHAEERWPPRTPAWKKRRGPPPQFLELYGIFPTLRVVRGRLLDEPRHACHAAIDDDALGEVTRTLRPRSGGGVGRQTRRARWVVRTRALLEEVRSARGLADVADLEDDPRWGRKLRRLRAAERPVAAIRAVQAHLTCDGVARREMTPGAFDRRTLQALERWQRMHLIVSRGVLDDDSREAILRPSRENDFRSLLRVLRERVVDAAGLLADGSAAGAAGTILGRTLDPPELEVMAARDALPGAAPDVVSPATEAAARALGWTDPDAATAWLRAEHPAGGRPVHRVAVALPPAPAWHREGEPLSIRAVIDRGDVWYRFPFFEDGRPRRRPVRRRPTTVVYVGDGDAARPVVRWSTTIGGWHRETGPDGTVGLAYKNSPVGRRVWRDILAAPTWMPPPATPDDELLRAGRTLMGPGFESAYGLVMLEHGKVRGAPYEDVVAGRFVAGDQPLPEEGGDGRGVRFGDEGIRTHGSVSYRSILSGESHGCHRLFNHLAVRLGGWLLAHRPHVRHGPQPARYRRTLTDDDDPERIVELRVDTRGDLFELTPPVAVTVLEGRLRGHPRRPIRGVVPIPEAPEEAAGPATAATPSPATAAGEAPSPTTAP